MHYAGLALLATLGAPLPELAKPNIRTLDANLTGADDGAKVIAANNWEFFIQTSSTVPCMNGQVLTQAECLTFKNQHDPTFRDPVTGRKTSSTYSGTTTSFAVNENVLPPGCQVCCAHALPAIHATFAEQATPCSCLTLDMLETMLMQWFGDAGWAAHYSRFLYNSATTGPGTNEQNAPNGKCTSGWCLASYSYQVCKRVCEMRRPTFARPPRLHTCSLPCTSWSQIIVPLLCMWQPLQTQNQIVPMIMPGSRSTCTGTGLSELSPQECASFRDAHLNYVDNNGVDVGTVGGFQISEPSIPHGCQVCVSLTCL